MGKLLKKECKIGVSYVGKTTKDDSFTFTKDCECPVACWNRSPEQYSHDATVMGSRDCWYNKTEVFNDWECTYYLGSCAIRTVKGKEGPRYLKTWCCDECDGYWFDAPICGNVDKYYVKSVYWDKCDKGNDCEKGGGPG